MATSRSTLRLASSRSPVITSLETIVPTAGRVGGKAARLIELRHAGFRVPEFVVSPADPAAAVAELGLPVAVRSSASVEDGAEASFAGQFHTVLDVDSLPALEGAIATCRASAFEPSVIEYCRRNGIDPTAIRMEVIVQRMLRPELAGVAFTVDPVTGAENVTIEATTGLGDGLLNGRVEPLPDDHPLLERYREEIVATALAVQRHYGRPQDVEFAIEGGELFVLQARPITRIGFAGVEGEWTNADFRDGGVSSSTCSSLMWSLYESAWDGTLKGAMRDLKLFPGEFVAARQFFGRPYWNLSAVKDALARLPGFVEREFDEDLDVRIAYEGGGRRTPVTIGGVLRALPTLLSIRSFFRRQDRLATSLLERGHEHLDHRYDQPTDVTAAFRELIEGPHAEIEGAYFRTIFAASLAKLDFLSAFPEADYGMLVAALPPLRHMEPVRVVQSIPERDRETLIRVVDRFRHHGRQGLDVLLPRWDEDREFVVEMLGGLSGSAGADPRPAYEEVRRTALAALPFWRRGAFRRKLDRLRRLVWLREEMRDLSNRVYYHVRRLALRIGEETGRGDDVFFATFREIVENDWSRVAGNRATYESFRNFRAPNEIGSRHELRTPSQSGSALRGIAASPGSATGRAFVANNVDEASRMEAGDVLVCPFTEPGWTPVLDRAAAVVTESGGQLSHAAVICREYGIPAVLGVEAATTRIPHGARLVVHGDRGEVERTESETKS